MQTFYKWKKYQRSQEFLELVQDGKANAVVTFSNHGVLVNGEPVNKESEKMIEFSQNMKQIDYIRYSMVKFTWDLIDAFLDKHPVHDVMVELKKNAEPTLGQVLCK